MHSLGLREVPIAHSKRFPTRRDQDSWLNEQVAFHKAPKRTIYLGLLAKVPASHSGRNFLRTEANHLIPKLRLGNFQFHILGRDPTIHQAWPENTSHLTIRAARGYRIYFPAVLVLGKISETNNKNLKIKPPRILFASKRTIRWLHRSKVANRMSQPASSVLGIFV